MACASAPREKSFWRPLAADLHDVSVDDDQFHDTLALENVLLFLGALPEPPEEPLDLVLRLVDRAEAFLALNGRWRGCSMSKPCSLRSIVQRRSPPLNFPDALNLARAQLGKHGVAIFFVSCDSFQTILTVYEVCRLLKHP